MISAIVANFIGQSMAIFASKHLFNVTWRQTFERLVFAIGGASTVWLGLYLNGKGW